jgi:hypothetical protein
MIHKYHSGSLGVSAGAPSDQVIIADQENDDWVSDWNVQVGILAAAAGVAAFLIGGPIAAAAAVAAILLLMLITEWQAEAVVLMHEVGHSIDIINYDSSWDEIYCPTKWCVMSKGNYENCQDSPAYCSQHWGQRDLSPVNP